MEQGGGWCDEEGYKRGSLGMWVNIRTETRVETRLGQLIRGQGVVMRRSVCMVSSNRLSNWVH